MSEIVGRHEGWARWGVTLWHAVAEPPWTACSLRFGWYDADVREHPPAEDVAAGLVCGNCLAHLERAAREGEGRARGQRGDSQIPHG